MPVWGIDAITFNGKPPENWTDDDRRVHSEGHVLSDPLDGLPLLDERRLEFARRLVIGKDATVTRVIDGNERRFHIGVATGLPSIASGGVTTFIAFDLPTIDHAIAYCNDRGLRIVRVVQNIVSGPPLDWPSPSDHDD